MAAFIAFTSWQGGYTEAYPSQDLPDPAVFGMPSEDDGGRADPLLSGVARAIAPYEPDIEAVLAAPTRVVIAAGVESRTTLTWRTSAALADRLGVPLTQFPSHHGGVLGPESGQEGGLRRSRPGCVRSSRATMTPRSCRERAQRCSVVCGR